MEKITSLRLYPYTQNHTLTNQLQYSKLSNPNPNYNFPLSLYTYINIHTPTHIVFSPLYSLCHSLSSVSLFPPSSFSQSDQFVLTSSAGFRILYLQRRTSIFQLAALHEFCSIVPPRHLISIGNRGF